MKIWRKIITRHRKVLEMICQRTVFNSQSNISPNLKAVTIKHRRVSLKIKQPQEEVQLSSSHPIGGLQRLKKLRSRKLQRNRNLQKLCESLK